MLHSNTALDALRVPRSHYKFKTSTKLTQGASQGLDLTHLRRRRRRGPAEDSWLLMLEIIRAVESASTSIETNSSGRFKGIIHKNSGYMGLTRPGERPLEDMFKAKHGMYARTYVFRVIFMAMGSNDGAQPAAAM